MTEPTAGAPATAADVSTPAPVTTIAASPASPPAAPVKAADEPAAHGDALSLQEQTHINAMPLVGTIEDPSGVERIVDLNLDSGWTPAPVESDPKVRDAIAARIAALEAKKQERLDLMKVKS